MVDRKQQRILFGHLKNCNMVLNRLGNKTKIASKVQSFFPSHTIYMELFLGAGGMFFNKPKAKYNFLNDLDYDVYNLFRQIVDNKDAFIRQLQLTPITEKQFKEWGKGFRESNDLLNAIRFIIISNYGLYGKSNTLRIGAVNPKKIILKNIEFTFNYLNGSYFFNTDFRNFFKKCDYKSNINKCFAYADPPYLETDNNYSNSFNESDSYDLFQTLESSGCKWAMSEFNHPFILEQAKERNLNVIYIGERQNLKNRRVEILVTNYENRQMSLW